MLETNREKATPTDTTDDNLPLYTAADIFYIHSDICIKHCFHRGVGSINMSTSLSFLTVTHFYKVISTCDVLLRFTCRAELTYQGTVAQKWGPLVHSKIELSETDLWRSQQPVWELVGGTRHTPWAIASKHSESDYQHFFLGKSPLPPSRQTIWETESQMVRNPLFTSPYPWDCLPHLFTLQPKEAWAGSEAGVEDVGSSGGAHCNNGRISNNLESLRPQREQTGYTLVKIISS